MKNNMNITLKSIATASLLAIPLALSFAVQQEEAVAETKVQHKVIEIKRSSNEPTLVEIDNDGEVHMIELLPEDIKSITVLNDKLVHLDEHTKELVLKIVKGQKFIDGDVSVDTEFISETIESLDIEGLEKELVFHINKNGDGQHFSTDKKVMVINGGEGMSFSGSLKGHHKGIIKLLEKGEFTRDELAEIQKALDAKY